jgi:hypothetical protein
MAAGNRPQTGRDLPTIWPQARLDSALTGMTKITLRPIRPLRSSPDGGNFLPRVPIPFMENGNAAHLTLLRDGSGNRDGISAQCGRGKCAGDGYNVQGRNYERDLGSRCMFRPRWCSEGRQRGKGSEGKQGSGCSFGHDGASTCQSGDGWLCDGNVQGRIDVEGRPRRMLWPWRRQERRSGNSCDGSPCRSCGIDAQAGEGDQGSKGFNRVQRNGGIGSEGRQQSGRRDRQVQGWTLLARDASSGRLQRARRRRQLDLIATNHRTNHRW